MILELLVDPNVWIAFAALTVMEIVLGIDNIVFISVLVSRLPQAQADRARKIGLALAMIFRIALLLVIAWIIALDQPVFEIFGVDLSWKDIILLAGGGFLIYKATHEMHAAIEEPHEPKLADKARATFSVIIGQIIVLDMVFSVDSIVTAVGMAEHVEVMIAAVIVAVSVMFVASGPVARFVADHPTTKMLALAFLLLIGVSLVAEGLGFHIPKGYIYSAMAFSVLVESVNIIAKKRRMRKSGAEPSVTPVSTGVIAVQAAGAAVPRSRPKSTPASRAKSRPKSAPRSQK
jgi:predicted tellurium resistance membrane protein TerC